MAIDMSAALEDYKRGASNNAEKLVRKYIAKTGKLDAAKSDAAEKLYAEKIAKAVAEKSRQKGLGKVTEAEMNAAMQSTGATNYRSGTDRSGPKWQKRFDPYAKTLDGLEGRLPAKTSDPMANLTNRAGAVLKAMVETKKRIG